ncbi:hypothetical protein C8R44DRAFT_974474 [Mycena epipterygia]|nr:hypothetical protein C8R44DRAFT_974474 [Mycena epipterygia]
MMSERGQDIIRDLATTSAFTRRSGLFGTREQFVDHQLISVPLPDSLNAHGHIEECLYGLSGAFTMRAQERIAHGEAIESGWYHDRRRRASLLIEGLAADALSEMRTLSSRIRTEEMRRRTVVVGLRTQIKNRHYLNTLAIDMRLAAAIYRMVRVGLELLRSDSEDDGVSVGEDDSDILD